jgi:hypothetical protein
MKIKKPLWKVTKFSKSGPYAQVLLRCHPDEFLEERAKMETYGSIKALTLEIFKRFQTDDNHKEILETIRAAHDKQLAEYKDFLRQQLKSYVGEMVSSGRIAIAEEEETTPESILDDLWESLEQ